MKIKIFTLLSLLAISSINAETYLSGINKDLYKGRIDVQPYTKSELSNLPKMSKKASPNSGGDELR